jgi:hypothetical protein
VGNESENTMASYHNRRKPLPANIKYDFCVFCKNNGEDEKYYLCHTLKDDQGRVIW